MIYKFQDHYENQHWTKQAFSVCQQFQKHVDPEGIKSQSNKRTK